MYVSVDTHTVTFLTSLHEIWQEPLGSEKEELIVLGSESENAFPYFVPLYYYHGAIKILIVLYCVLYPPKKP